MPNGWTGPATPVSGVTVANCVIQSAPQAGVVMLGVSDITVTDLRAENTQADGLHFNACRRVKVDGHTAVNTGDDGLALVTYFSDTSSYDPAAQTFAFPGLTEWSNADFSISNVAVSGGRANGVRLAGALRVDINGLTVTDVQHGAGVMIDSATAGHEVEWEYVSARDLTLSDLTVEDCETGIHVLARPADTDDQRFTDFAIDIADAQLRRCTNWSVRVESLSDQPVNRGEPRRLHDRRDVGGGRQRRRRARQHPRCALRSPHDRACAGRHHVLRDQHPGAEGRESGIDAYPAEGFRRCGALRSFRGHRRRDRLDGSALAFGTRIMDNQSC